MFARSIPATLRHERDLLVLRIRRLERMLDHPGEFDRSRDILVRCLGELREELGVVMAALAKHPPQASPGDRAAALGLTLQNGGVK